MTLSVSRWAAFQVLRQSAARNVRLHAALHDLWSGREMTAADAGLAMEIAMGATQWGRLLDAWIEGLSGRPANRVDPDVRVALRMGLYQIRFLSRVPAYAAVDQSVALVKTVRPRAAGFVNAVLRNALRDDGHPRPIRSFAEAEGVSDAEVALRLSYPDWIVRQWMDDYGRERTVRVLLDLHERPPKTVRVNSSRLERADLIQGLLDEGVASEPSPVSPYGLRIEQGVHVPGLRAFRDGLCSLQGESSMLVAPLLSPKEGMRVLDACAAPGGKTAHIAELARDGAAVDAVEVSPGRADGIVRQMERLGLRGVRVLVSDARAVRGMYDAVLLDAPCTGFGTIARKPDIKDAATPKSARSLEALQRELLRSLADRVRAGGVLLYTTCTLSRRENERQIEQFLQERKDFAPVELRGLPPETAARADAEGWRGMAQILPGDFGGDGFFIAKLQKRGTRPG